MAKHGLGFQGGSRQANYLFMFAVIIFILFSGAALTVYYNRQAIQHLADERLNFYENVLRLQLDKYNYLPFLVAGSTEVKEFFSGEGSEEQVNHFLKEVCTKAGATAVYILDSKGVALCSSNWDQKNTYVGLDLSFRPYFKASIKGKGKKFYGVGFAAEQPGYYISCPIVQDGVTKGVSVAKIDLSRLQEVWMEGGENLFVTNADDIIILSSRPEWRYRTLTPLAPETMHQIQEGGQFPEPSLRPLDWHTVLADYLGLVQINGSFFLKSSREIKGMSWSISYLVGAKPVLERGGFAVLVLFAFVGATLVVRMFFREKRLKELSLRQAEEAYKIRLMNMQLAQEVEERERTEKDLREAQKELIEAGKLAALGEMATAVAHELNQPIAALKMYIASCRLMLERNDTAELDSTLLNVLGISDRMAKVTGQLKAYARKSSDSEGAFEVRAAVDETLSLMQHQFEHEFCKFKADYSCPDLSVSGDRGRFEQVLINLFRNALDAMKDQDEKLLKVDVVHENETVVISVADNGPGIAPEVEEKVFEPFVTTKEEGVGLGLSISYKAIKEMGGRMWSDNRPEGGGVFFLELPLKRTPEDSND